MLGILLGGMVGVISRWGIQVLAQSVWATLLINFLGSAAMAWVMTSLPESAFRLALTTGVLGGFTTFSAYSWDSVLLFSRGQWALGLAYFLGSPALGLLGAALIYALRR